MDYIDPEGKALPVKTLTVNQLIAGNVAFFRQGLKMTQERLAELLSELTGKPWSKVTVSAAERSFYGGRVRLFDADDLVALAQALEVPVPAFFLPPMDDGTRHRYEFVATPNGEPLTAAGLMDLLFPSAQWGGDALLIYRGRVRYADEAYFGRSRFHDAMSYVLDPETAESEAKDALAAELEQSINLLRRILSSLQPLPMPADESKEQS